MKAAFQDSKLYGILVIASLILGLFDYLSWLNLPKAIIGVLIQPVQYGFYQTGKNIAAQFEFILKSRQLSYKYTALNKQFADVLSENARLKSELVELKAINSQNQFLNQTIFSLMPAKILSSQPNLIIDKGSEDGAKVNQPVVYGDSYIGRIIKAGPKKSVILTSSQPESKIAVFSQNKDGRARGILQGEFGSEVTMTKILHNEVLVVGDFVYSEGSDSLPRGLVLGTVDRVIDNQTEVFKAALIKPIYELKDLDLLFVIKD